MPQERQAIFSSGAADSGGSWDFRGEQTQTLLHSLHAYPARFIPQIPHRAIAERTVPGDTVLDPFAGCGTTLLESVVMGRPAVGVDNNAVACLVSRAKTRRYSDRDLDQLDALHARINDIAADAGIVPDVPHYPNMEHWFDPAAVEELGRLRAAIRQLAPDAQLLAMAAFSAIIVAVSYQDSDTRYSCVPYDYTPGRAARLYRARLASAIAEARATRGLIAADAQVHLHDGRCLEFIPDGSAALIVTSPPYLNAYDYHKYHRHRLQWIDGNVAMARDLEIGKHDTFTRRGATPDGYFADMARCFAEWRRVLRPGGAAVIVVGDAIVSGQPVDVGDRFVDMLCAGGFRLDRRSIRTVDSTRKSFNQQSRITREHVLEFIWQP